VVRLGLVTVGFLAVGIIGVLSAVSVSPAFFTVEYLQLTAERKEGRKLPGSAVLLAGIAGVGAIVPAFYLTSDLGGAGITGMTAVSAVYIHLFVVPIEELVKSSMAYLIGSGYRLSPIGYAVVGAFVGLGFSFGENAVYILSYGVLGGELVQTVLERSVVASFHVLLSTVAAYHIGKARQSMRATDAVKGLSVAVAVHVAYNLMASFSGTASLAQKAAVSVMFIALLWMSIRRVGQYSMRGFAGLW
jgi:RsiW-degrading membrane proteinase PrsW (M82 family)